MEMVTVNEQAFELIKQRLDELHENQTAIFDELKGGFEKMNGRVKKLESWRSWMLGVIAVIGVLVVPIAVKVVAQIISKVLFHI